MKLPGKYSFFVSIILFLITSTCLAQQKKLTRQDYKRAEHFLPAYTDSMVHHTVSNATWLEDGKLIYSDAAAGGNVFKIYDPSTGQIKDAFNQKKLSESLSKVLNRHVDPMHLPIRELGLTNNGHTLYFSVGRTKYRCNLNTYDCEYRAAGNDVLSPDGTKAVFIRDYNLWMRDVKTGKLTQLTFNGKKNYGYGTNNGGWITSDIPVVRWSPNSERIATFRQDARLVKNMYLVQTKIGHPKLMKWKYSLPGDSAIFKIERVVIDLKPHPHVVHLKMKADAQRSTISDDIAGRGGEFLDTEWGPNSDKLAFASVSRNLQSVTLRMADPQTGDVHKILNEKVKTFFESGANKVNWHVLPESNEAIWYSQRSNWGHLYLYNLKTGKLEHPITKGDWNVLQVRYIDRKNHKIYFTGSCRHEGNPYYHYFYSVDFSGKHLKLLTPKTADHEITVSKDGKYFVDTYSTPITPPVSVVRNNNGRKIKTLDKANIAELKATGWKPPTPFTVKARDGKTNLYGMMFKPTNFNPNKSYPVLVYIYPGPQTGSVGGWSFSAARMDKQSMAELGFIVVEENALGTPGRSKSFQDYWYGDMGDNGLPDQVAMVKQLSKKYSWMNQNEVGIWGHSGGGFATTRAMLTYPNFFKVGVSEAGNEDNRDYEADWGEKYEGLLKTYGDSTNYDNQANELLAHNLKGKLLLAKGTMDNNVPPYCTYLMVDSLEAANKDFDLIILPNRHHGFYFDPYMVRRRWNYFVRNLEHAVPPEEFDIKVH